MTEFEKIYQNYNPPSGCAGRGTRSADRCCQAAMADGALPEAELPAFIVEIPADTKNGDIAPTSPWPVHAAGARLPR